MNSLKELEKLSASANAKVLEMINAVIDEQSLMETDRFILGNTDEGKAAGEGVVSGFATINGINVALFAINSGVLKGGIGKRNAAKISKLTANAVKTGAPIVAFIDTYGARLGEGIDALEGYGEILKVFAAAKSEVASFLVVKGNNLGLLSYLSGICDFTYCYSKSVIATASPLVLAEGKENGAVINGKTLAENGIATRIVASDEELRENITKVLSFITDGVSEPTDDGNRVCDTLKHGSSAAKVIGDVFDIGSFYSLYEKAGVEVITGFARLNGIAVAVVCNDKSKDGGLLTASGAEKVSKLLDLAVAFDMPVVNITDCSGVKSTYNTQSQLVKSVGDLIYNYSTIELPKIAMITGNAIGAGYTIFASKSVFDYTIAWEKATVGLLDSQKTAELVYAEELKKSKDKNKLLTKLAKQYDAENMSAAYLASEGYIDNVITPEFSRQYLIEAVQTFMFKR